MHEFIKKLGLEKENGYALFINKEGKSYTECSGYTVDENSSCINMFTRFRLASVSKQFIAFAVLTLLKKNNIMINTPVLSIFNELPIYFKDITIEHLLSHKSGLFDYEDMDHSDEQINDDDVFEFLKSTNRTYFEPGSKYRYSNTGYVLLGLMIKKLSSKKLDVYLEDLFKEIGLHHTIVYSKDKYIENRAYGHIYENDKLVVKDQYWCSATIGDGGIYSNLIDLDKWSDYLFNSEIGKFMMESHSTIDEFENYGLGLKIVNNHGKIVYYHCGETIGTNTLILFSKDYDYKVILLTNTGCVDTSSIVKYILSLFGRF